MLRYLVFFLVSCCHAQRFEFGVKAGARVTGDVEGFATSESKRYLIGPAIETRFLRKFGVEFDALYSRFGYRTANSDPLGGGYTERVRANSWEFPIVLKYRLRHIYALSGISFRRTTGGYRGTGVSVGPGGQRSTYQVSGELQFRTTTGAVAGGGCEFRPGRIRLSPEVRYVRWNTDRIGIYGSRGFYIAGPQNDVEILFGLTWR